MTSARPLALLAPLVLIAGCSEDAASPESDGREASGEVLEGSISDAMLPIDEVRSQAPLAASEPSEGAPSPAPAQEPSPEPAPEPALDPPAESNEEPAD